MGNMLTQHRQSDGSCSDYICEFILRPSTAKAGVVMARSLLTDVAWVFGIVAVLGLLFQDFSLIIRSGLY